MWKRRMLSSAAAGWETVGEGPLLKDANHNAFAETPVELCHRLCFVSQIFKMPM